jgi:hypothetical protein
LQVVRVTRGEPSIARAPSCSLLSSMPWSGVVVGWSPQLPRVVRFGFCLGCVGDALVSPCYASGWLSSSLVVPYLCFVLSVNFAPS